MSSDAIYYVYRITNTLDDKHYYGVRKTHVPPEEDLGVLYFSSSSDKDFIQEQQQNPSIFRYIIVRSFTSKEDAYEAERRLHRIFDVANNPKFYNKATSYGKFQTRKNREYEIVNAETGEERIVTIPEMKDNLEEYGCHKKIISHQRSSTGWERKDRADTREFTDKDPYERSTFVFQHMETKEEFVGTYHDLHKEKHYDCQMSYMMKGLSRRSFRSWIVKEKLSHRESEREEARNKKVIMLDTRIGMPVMMSINELCDEFNCTVPNAVEFVSNKTTSLRKTMKRFISYEHHGINRYEFVHITGEGFFGTIEDFIMHSNVKRERALQLIRGDRMAVNEWRLSSTPLEMAGHMQFADHTVYDFVNDITGVEISCTMYELKRLYDIPRNVSNISRVVRGEKKSWEGWRLASTPKDEVGGTRNIQYWFMHEEKGIMEFSTASEIAKRYNLSPNSFNRIRRGERSHYRGWKFVQ